MTEQFTDLVECRPGFDRVGGEAVTQLVRMDTSRQSSAFRQIGEQFVEGGRPHRRAQWFTKEIDQQEITSSRLEARVSLQHVLVEGLHDHPVHGDHSGSAGLRGRAVGVVAAADVHVFAAHAAAQSRGVGYEVHVFYPQPGQFAAAMANAPQRQHDEAVPCVAARSEHRQDLLTGDRVNNALRFGKPMPGFGSHTELRPGSNVAGQVEVFDHVEQDVQNAVVDLADRGGMTEELANSRQDDIDPTRPPHNPCNRTRCTIRVKVLQPKDEAPKLAGGRAPVAFDRGTPLEEQRQCTGVGLRGRLRTVTAHAEMQQPVIGHLDGAVSQIDHGPVALARRQFDPKRSERPHRVRRYGLQPSATVSDTPSDRVGHHRQHHSVRPSPTPLAPVQNDLSVRWVPDQWIHAVHESMCSNPQWQYITLTKFPTRYVSLDIPSGAWVGTSVDTQARVRIAQDAFSRIDGVAVKWLSLEPLLEPLEFDDLSMFDWVVIGAQTATNQPDGRVKAFAPPFEWVAAIVDQARRAGCRIHLKPNLLGAINPKSPGMQLPNEYPELSTAMSHHGLSTNSAGTERNHRR